MPLTTRRVTCNVALVNLAAAVLGRVDRVLVGGHARAEEDVLAHAPVGAQDVLELGDARALGALRGRGAADGAGVGLVRPTPGTRLHQLISRVGWCAVWSRRAIPVAVAKQAQQNEKG